MAGFPFSVQRPLHDRAFASIGLATLLGARLPERTMLASVLLTVAILCPSAMAEVTIETVLVGNPGNKGELSGESAGGRGADAIVGHVPYEYRIGKYEVTNAQYAEFLNEVDPSGANNFELYSRAMSDDPMGGITFESGAANGSKYAVKAGRDNSPVVHVTPYDAFRFANWLHNGQGSGDTETGAYTLLGGTPTPTNEPDLEVATESVTVMIKREPGARWFLPTEDEWYKAAYHKNDGVTGNYWDYPTSTDEIPYGVQPPGSNAPIPSNTANFFRKGWNDRRGNKNMLTDVGAYSLSVSPYGTFDQGGNVAEWTESLIIRHEIRDGIQMVKLFRRGRGGNWTHNPRCMSASYRGCGRGPRRGPPDRGFRVACIATLRSDGLKRD